MSKRAQELRLHPATIEDLAFARELTRINMRSYYACHGLVWQPEAFDAQWPLRESFLIRKAGTVIGFLGFTVEENHVYVRDIQLIEAYRGEGVGAWVMTRVVQMAADRGLGSIRLKVFRSNPAASLYRRLGYTSKGGNDALLWMERPVAARQDAI